MAPKPEGLNKLDDSLWGPLTEFDYLPRTIHMVRKETDEKGVWENTLTITFNYPQHMHMPGEAFIAPATITVVAKNAIDERIQESINRFSELGYDTWQTYIEHRKELGMMFMMDANIEPTTEDWIKSLNGS